MGSVLLLAIISSTQTKATKQDWPFAVSLTIVN
jgi:hypothetical protein